MSYNKREDGFAEIVIEGEGNGKMSDGYKIPDSGRSKYAGKGAYLADAIRYKAEEETLLKYRSELSFIGDVTVYTWGAKRSFYERFREDALRYREMKSEPCPEVPFFSYIPQYSQMNLYQSNFYLYFREMAKKGEYIHGDISYILLYIYEIINLSDVSDPAEDLRDLCGIWTTYRELYPVLDKYMSEWVCDFCLLYHLPVPECTCAFLPKLCEAATLREFYMSAAVKDGATLDGNILTAFADYDFRRSRIEIPDEYHHHFPKALQIACSIYDAGYFVADKPILMQRDAFCGSLCAHNVKRKISVEYYPAFRKSGIRHMLGSAVKYTENKIRRLMGVKSRLHTDGLSDTAKLLIDNYFAELYPEIFSGRVVKKQEIPEYEKFYDAPAVPFTADDAQRIELESRQAAEMLASFDEAEDIPAVETPEIIEIAEESTVDVKAEDANSANVVREVIRHMLEGGELDSWCRSRDILPDTVAGQVNEAAMDYIGDALLEFTDGSWQLIVDYLEEAAEMAVE